MRTLFLSIILSLSMISLCMADLSDHSYLKIELHQKTISYPPGTPFVAKNAKGATVLSMYDLKQISTYTITKPITLFVYISWSDSPDVYELDKGTLSLVKTNDQLKKIETPSKGYFESESKTNNTNDDHNEKVHDNVYLIKKQYFSYDEKTGYDVSLQFSNGILFLYRDGEVNAWKNGKSLPIKHKYIIQTNQGNLKLSYNPKTKKIWWIFDKK